MIRFLALAILALLLYLLMRAVAAAFVAGLRGPARGGRVSRPLRDELVKDPVCATYVPRRTAIARTVGPTTYYFCSPVCAEKFKLPA